MPKYPTLKSRKIKYNSPSGFVHIGKYVPPFEKNDSGFGFKGVLIEDFESGKIQCSICGEWFEQMARHLETHQINSKDYKLKFGLLLSTALKSKEMRLHQSKVMIARRKSDKKYRGRFKKNNLFAGNRKYKPKALESRNKYGVCDLQLMERIIQLKEELGKTPTLIDLKEKYGMGMMALIHKRYGSYIKLCRNLGMNPNFSNWNPKYSREYFIEKALNQVPSTRIFTINEMGAFYKYFKSIEELKLAIEQRR